VRSGGARRGEKRNARKGNQGGALKTRLTKRVQVSRPRTSGMSKKKGML